MTDLPLIEALLSDVETLSIFIIHSMQSSQSFMPAALIYPFEVYVIASTQPLLIHIHNCCLHARCPFSFNIILRIKSILTNSTLLMLQFHNFLIILMWLYQSFHSYASPYLFLPTETKHCHGYLCDTNYICSNLFIPIL